MKRVNILLTAILFLLLATNISWSQSGGPSGEADDVSVHTTTGLRFVGRLISEDDDKLTLQTRSGEIDIPRRIISRIDRAKEDRRPASERIAATEVPPGQEAEFLQKAGEAFKANEHETVVSICKGLRARSSDLEAEQRETMHKLASASYFTLKDWRATALHMRFASKTVESDIDRQRLEAIAEAVEASNMPDVGGKAVATFDELKQVAMKWKADQIVKQSIDYMLGQRDLHRQESLAKALEVAKQTLAGVEVYVPGYSLEQWPQVVKATADFMLTAVERAVPRMEDEREELVRTYVVAIGSPRHAASRNELVIAYLTKRIASASTLENLTWLEETHEDVPELYNKETAGNLAKKVEELRFYHKEPINASRFRIQIKGLEIKPMQIGG